MIHRNSKIKQRVDIYRRMNDRKLGTPLQITQPKSGYGVKLTANTDKWKRKMSYET